MVLNQGTAIEFDTLELNSETSKKVFKRTGEISKIIVSVVK